MSKPHVTPRETEIINWLAKGKTADEIGIILGISGYTVKTITARARQRLDMVNCTQLCAMAVREGIIQ